MSMARNRLSSEIVALLAEGVDRNQPLAANGVGHVRRPPRGGRG